VRARTAGGGREQQGATGVVAAAGWRWSRAQERTGVHGRALWVEQGRTGCDRGGEEEIGASPRPWGLGSGREEEDGDVADGVEAGRRGGGSRPARKSGEVQAAARWLR